MLEHRRVNWQLDAQSDLMRNIRLLEKTENLLHAITQAGPSSTDVP